MPDTVVVCNLVTCGERLHNWVVFFGHSGVFSRGLILNYQIESCAEYSTIQFRLWHSVFEIATKLVFYRSKLFLYYFCIYFLAQLSRPASAQPIGLPSLAIVAKSCEAGNQLVAAALVLSAPLCSTTIDLG